MPIGATSTRVKVPGLTGRIGIGLLAALIALGLFRRRDLLGA